MPGLVTPWDAKVGVNYRKAPVPNAEFLPSPLPDSTPPDQSTGVGWANLTTSRVPLGWDKATIETQVDPLDEQSKLGTTLSRSMPLGDELSLTLQNHFLGLPCVRQLERIEFRRLAQRAVGPANRRCVSTCCRRTRRCRSARNSPAATTNGGPP